MNRGYTKMTIIKYKTDDLEKMNTTIAVLETIKCLTEKHADYLEQLEV